MEINRVSLKNSRFVTRERSKKPAFLVWVSLKNSRFTTRERSKKPAFYVLNVKPMLDQLQTQRQ
ncbi:MAG TPA: hypothetical protein DCY88_29180 [Cyanobacteria bacterium UBA11372]|nr:hypothetical protein [Cyanobacteria bacterium UBA11372]